MVESMLKNLGELDSELSKRESSKQLEQHLQEVSEAKLNPNWRLIEEEKQHALNAADFWGKTRRINEKLSDELEYMRKYLLDLWVGDSKRLDAMKSAIEQEKKEGEEFMKKLDEFARLMKM